MHPRLRTLWLTWTAILAAMLLALALVVGALAEDAARKLAEPQLEQTTQLIGHSLAHEIERVLGYQVPVNALVGVDDWFGGIVDANRMLTAMALIDTSGHALAAYGVEPDTLRVLTTRRSEQSNTVNDVFISTMALRDRNGAVVAWLHVGGVAPDTGHAVWLWPLSAALALAALGSLLLRALIQRRFARPLADCQTAATSLANGELPVLHGAAVRDPATRLRAALAERIHSVRRHNANLLLKIGEVRAAHFDPAVLQALDELARPLSGRQREEQTQIDALTHSPARSAASRAILATVAALLLVGLGLLALQQVYRHADAQRLINSADQSLQQAWAATLDQDQTTLDSKLQTLLSEPHFMALLAGNDDPALDAELERLSSPQLALAVFNLDGSARVASGQHDKSTRLDPLTLEPLTHGVADIHGIWQNAARAYQSGVARRVGIGRGRSLIVMVAQPLDFSLEGLSHRLEAPTAVADLRGQPVSQNGAALVALWNHAARRSHLSDGGDTILVAQPLTAPSGHPIGTLLTSLSSQNQLGAGSRLLILLSLVAVAITALILLFYLRELFAPLARTTKTLEELADGQTDLEALSAEPSREMWQQNSVVRRIAEKIDALETLRRARERQGRRQARFIRLQMMQLAERLDEGARRGILEDLERIEHAGQPVATPDIDPRLERIVDEFGILALGFQNLVSRVGQQYQELDRLVSELREALRAKTQFIALQQELEIARNMQLSILPREFKPFNGLELHAAMVPAKEIGGDFYDFFSLDEHRVALVVADVSGKGVPAAFFMAISRTLLRAIAQFSDSPASCVARVNELLAADNEEMMFVTLFYAIFDTRDGSLVYANAGHNLPYLMRADGRIEAVPGTHGIALAVVDEFVFEEGRLTLEPGDGLFMYTDGITEASDASEQLYGDLRLVAALGELRDLPVREIPNRMVELIKQYETGVAQADDITCLMARYRGRA